MTASEEPYTKPYAVNEPSTDLAAAFRAGEVPVAVYGLGKMGLPIAATFAERCGNVTGVDLDPDVVDSVAAGECHLDGEPGLPELIARTVADGALTATTDGEVAASGARVHVLIVPTLLDEANEPDLSALEAAVDDVAAGLSSGDVVFVESTVPPRTCAEVIHPRLAEQSGLAREEFGLAFCPERTSTGRALEDIQGAYPKIVGGVDEESTRVAEAVYGEITTNDVVPVSDAATAECVKLFEGVFRDVNIALANELGTLVEDLSVDVREAIDAANTQPYCDIHDPGAGVGGHCIPYYPHFLTSRCETQTPLLETAREVNDGMAAFTARQAERELARAGTDIEDAAVAVLGVTYRPGIDEIRASPAFAVCETLTDSGADVYAVDPVCTSVDAFDATPADVADLGEIDPDGLVLVTAHDEFADLPWDRLDDPVVVDGRDALSDASTDRVYTVGSGARR